MFLSVNKPFSSLTKDFLAIIFSLIAAVVAVRFTLPYSAFPYDDGLMAQMAERVLNGETPHVDFAETYSGGLTFYHAWLFKTFGMSFKVLRLGLVPIFLIYVLACYVVCRNFLSPFISLCIVVLCIVYGPSQYWAPLPSRYLPCLAMIECAALSLFRCKENYIWLLVAGLVAGIACIIKITGILFVFPIIILLIGFTQEIRKETILRSTDKASRYRIITYFIWSFLLASAIFPLFILASFISKSFTYFLLFAAPIEILAICIFFRERKLQALWNAQGARIIIKGCIASVIGLSLPIACFLAAFHWSDLKHIAMNLIEQPRMHMLNVVKEPPTIQFFALAVLVWFVCGWAIRVVKMYRLRNTLAMVLLASMVLMVSGLLWSQLEWITLGIIAFNLLVFLPQAFCLTTLYVCDEKSKFNNAMMGILLVSFCCLVNVFQFPWTVPIYQMATMPAGIVFGAFLLSQNMIKENTYSRFVILLVCNLLMLGVTFWYAHQPSSSKQRFLAEARGEVLVDEYYGEWIGEIYHVVRMHSKEGEPIFFAPGRPEVYFLCHRRNPTKYFFEDLDPSSILSGRQLRRLVLRKSIKMVILNKKGPHSPLLEKSMFRVSHHLFERHKRIRGTEIFWKRLGRSPRLRGPQYQAVTSG